MDGRRVRRGEFFLGGYTTVRMLEDGELLRLRLGLRLRCRPRLRPRDRMGLLLELRMLLRLSRLAMEDASVTDRPDVLVLLLLDNFP